ncbi:hypothetical protein Q4Q35_17360 [Flavivirga aquimarina]|uniref:Outer membrane protein beta-barrel domain-containing protein n=1 Tax=Flavivirga aquimarina TaxID=2027862 RepID=A0ABT8WEI8_9FLAO|nr:DUF6588 family protein [Flavivirga aquimarina]MDO5971575.1 hypothetical protein [Flavivirga aquimarina]
MKKLTLLCLLLLVTHVSRSQELESILLAAGEDANKLAKSYMNPAMSGLIYGMNSGWYHTAKVHKKLGFDITIGLNASKVPSKDELFSIADLGLTSITAPGSPLTPTVAGSGDGTTLNVNAIVQGQAVTASFDMPSGIDDDLPLGSIPTPAIQAGVGLPYKFDVMLRFVPEVGSDDAKGKLFGVGLKKEITSILGPLDKLPLHLSVLAAYTSMNVNYTMDGTEIPGDNQRAEFKLNSFTVQAIGSLNFPIINVYAGLGYGGGNSTLKMLGTYDLEYTPIASGPTITETVTDPLNLDFDAGGFRTTLGLRLSLGFFKIFADYTLQEYNTLSAGIAFSFR